MLPELLAILCLHGAGSSRPSSFFIDYNTKQEKNHDTNTHSIYSSLHNKAYALCSLHPIYIHSSPIYRSTDEKTVFPYIE